MNPRVIIPFVACVFGASVAHAQSRVIGQATGRPIAPGIERVDQGYEDTGPLTLSLRIEGADLRAPSGFDEVLQFTDADGNSSLARVSGNLFATFDRSVYQPTRQGLLAEVPPGTVFWIGTPPDWIRDPAPTVRRSPLFVNHAVPLARGTEPAPATGPGSDAGFGSDPAAYPAPPTMTVSAPVNRLWRNEGERSEIVRYRLRQAAQRSRGF